MAGKSKKRGRATMPGKAISTRKLDRKMDRIQAKLDRLSQYNRPYEDILKTARQSYHRQEHVEALLKEANSGRMPLRNYVFIFIAGFLGFTALFYTLLSLYSGTLITGKAVQEVADAASHPFVSAAGIMLTAVIILGLTLHHADLRYRHRYDKYKPPFSR